MQKFFKNFPLLTKRKLRQSLSLPGKMPLAYLISCKSRAQKAQNFQRK